MIKQVGKFFSNFRPGDYVILIIILLAAFLSSYTFFSSSHKSDTFVIKSDKKEYEYSLHTDRIYEIQGRIGITKVRVRNGKVSIIESPCQNKNCIRQGEAGNIICLPNGIIVSVKKSGDFDAVSQ